MFFSYTDFGETLTLFSLQHVLSILVFAVLPVILLFIFKKSLLKSKVEPAIRITLGVFGLLLEFGLYAWYIFSGGITDWRQVAPTTLCGLSIYLSSYAMITLSKRISPVVYFYSFGAMLSFIVADTSFGFNRFRFYTYFIIHGLIIVEAIYLRVIHRVKADKKAFYSACLLLLPFLAGSVLMNQIFDMNFFYMKYPILEGFPVFQQLYDLNWIYYSIAVFISYYIFMLIMYGIAKLATQVNPGVTSGTVLAD
ncbi:MAG: TMEM164-related integral membrane acyltransferase [Saccharofermentanales bacterium]